MRPFLAMITPIGDMGGPVDPGYGNPGVGIPQPPSGNYPSHPIYYPPVAGWPGGLPGGGGFPGQGGPTPTPQPPLQIWGGPYDPPRIWGGPGSLPPYPDNTLPTPPGSGQPVYPSHPIYYPPMPSHPIYWPGGPPGSAPPGIWGGGMGPGVKPQPPLPPKPTEPPPDNMAKPPPPEGGWGYHPDFGWGYFPPSTEATPKT